MMIYSRSNCRCLEGFEGNAYTGCTAIGCRVDSECPERKACYDGDCLDPCIRESPCAPAHATCLVSAHIAQCRCDIGYTGDAYRLCSPLPAPECVQDADCPSKTVCHEQKCADPCPIFEPCRAPARCLVADTLPVRTMVCACPDGYHATEDGGCDVLPPIKTGCEADDECDSPLACINAICKDPCACGRNAQCDIVEHRPVCTCKPGFYGDPKVECIPVECFTDADCADTHACRLQKCTPVCGPDDLPCGGNAVCRGVQHQAVCTCPPGLKGDPYVTCATRDCTHDSDCPPEKACINDHCVDPCAIANPCDNSAECRVRDHEVDCSCPPGFQGDRGTACVRVEVSAQLESGLPDGEV